MSEFPEEGTWTPYAPGRILGPVLATRDIHFVYATGDVVGAIAAQTGFINGVNADGSITGAVTAGTDVGRWVSRDADLDWRPFGHFGDPYHNSFGAHLPRGAGVFAGEAVSGSVTATTGDVTAVTGVSGVSGDVNAGRDVGSVWAGAFALEDPSESATPAHLSGDVTAGRDISDVSATGDVSGAIDAGHGIGGVTAGGDITSTISATAALGRLDDTDPHYPQHHPYASFEENPFWGPGVRAGGSFTGSLTAGTDVARVEAGGVVAGTIDAGRDVGFVHGTAGVTAAVTAARDLGSVYAGGYGYTGFYATWQELPDVAPGNFAGSLDAAGGIKGVWATGSIAGTIAAGQSIGYLNTELAPDVEVVFCEVGPLPFGPGVQARQDVSARITAGEDITGIEAGRSVLGAIAAGDTVGGVAARGGAIRGDVTAGEHISWALALGPPARGRRRRQCRPSIRRPSPAASRNGSVPSGRRWRVGATSAAV